MPEDEVDREFARIVAGWHTSPVTDADADGVDRDGPSEPPVVPIVPVIPSVPAIPSVPVIPPEPVLPPPGRDEDDPPAGSVESWLDETYVPPPVRLPGEEDPQFWGIVLGLTLGPLALILLMVFGDGWSPWWSRAAWAMTLGGFILLVLRQPTHRDHNDPDDGARV